MSASHHLPDLSMLATLNNVDGLRNALPSWAAAVSEMSNKQRKLHQESLGRATEIAVLHHHMDCVDLLLPGCPSWTLPGILAAAARAECMPILEKLIPKTQAQHHQEALMNAAMRNCTHAIVRLVPIGNPNAAAHHLATHYAESADRLAPFVLLETLEYILDRLPHAPLPETRVRLAAHQDAAALETRTAPAARATPSRRI